MWWTYALLSALFASGTAILAKVGVKGINSDLATAIRTVSILLIAEVKNLIVGESMPRESRQSIRNIVHKFKQIRHINRLQTMVMGDSKYLVLLSVDINDEMKGSDAEDMIEKLKLALKKEIPEIGTLYIEIKDSVRNQEA